MTTYRCIFCHQQFGHEAGLLDHSCPGHPPVRPEQIKVGARIQHTAKSPWTSRDGTEGVEVVTVVSRVTAVLPFRFEYVVEERVSVVDPLPGTEGKGWTCGGMAFFALEKPQFDVTLVSPAPSDVVEYVAQAWDGEAYTDYATFEDKKQAGEEAARLRKRERAAGKPATARILGRRLAEVK